MDIRLTGSTVEVFFHGSRVASHPRQSKVLRDPIIQPEHMLVEHRLYLKRNADEFRIWAENIGSQTRAVVEFFLTNGSEPELGYKDCASLTKLADRYGHERLEKACDRVLGYASSPTVRNIAAILKNGQDKLSTAPQQEAVHKQGGGISRGPAYYRRGGASYVE